MKRRIVASVTERGQVTIPAEVRKRLGLKPGDKVEFVMEDGTVSLEKPRYTLETAYGSVKPIYRDIDEMIEEAKEERAERLVKKLRGE